MNINNLFNLKHIWITLLVFIAWTILGSCSDNEDKVYPEQPEQPENPLPITEKKIPVIVIETEEHAEITDKENYVNCSVKIIDESKLYTDGTVFNGTGGIRGRGNTTWMMPKKPYKIKLDNKAKLLGMSTDKEWALLANYSDRSLLRNTTAFEISRIVGMDWTPRSSNVELYINDKYLGVYQLTEQVKVSKERSNLNIVDENATKEEDLKADYLIELDHYFDEDYKFRTNIADLPLMFKDPKKPNQEQFDYVQHCFNHAEAILYGKSFLDSEFGYRQYIDIDSFLKFYIVQELSKNVDGNMRGSCYMALKSDGKIYQPFVWDFDIAFGNAKHITWEQGADSAGPDGWYIKTCSPWFDRFFLDPIFVSTLKKKWNSLKPQLDKLPDYIQEQANLLEAAAGRNFKNVSPDGAGWSIHREIWPNFEDRGSYAAEVEFLKNFVIERLKWLDEHINAL